MQEWFAKPELEDKFQFHFQRDHEEVQSLADSAQIFLTQGGPSCPAVGPFESANVTAPIASTAGRDYPEFPLCKSRIPVQAGTDFL